MTDTIAGVKKPVTIDQQQLARELVEQARAEGVELVGAGGLLAGSAHFADVYGASVSKDTVSRITDKVIEEMTEWMNRPLDKGRFPVIVANHGLTVWRCHRRMAWSGEREPAPVSRTPGLRR